MFWYVLTSDENFYGRKECNCLLNRNPCSLFIPRWPWFFELWRRRTRPGGNQSFYLEIRNLLKCSWSHVFIFIQNIIIRKKNLDIHRASNMVFLLRWLISYTQNWNLSCVIALLCLNKCILTVKGAGVEGQSYQCGMWKMKWQSQCFTMVKQDKGSGYKNKSSDGCFPLLLRCEAGMPWT